MSTKTLPWSTLTHAGASAVVPLLGDADLILQRRGEDDVVLMSDERYKAASQALRLAARSLSILARKHRNLAEDVLDEELPWLVWLPSAERPQALREILDHLIAGADTGELLPVARALNSWQATAVAWSDPETARRLADPFDGTGGQELSRPGGGDAE